MQTTNYQNKLPISVYVYMYTMDGYSPIVTT